MHNSLSTSFIVFKLPFEPVQCIKSVGTLTDVLQSFAICIYILNLALLQSLYNRVVCVPFAMYLKPRL